MILAPVTIRCPSNGRSASSTSGLLALAAQSSAGLAACSCLPWPAVLPWRPHRPYYSHRWPGPAATVASHRSRTTEPPYSSPRGLPLPRLPWHRVIPFLGLAVAHRLGALGRRGQRGQGTTSIGRVLYMERLIVGSTAAAGKCHLITCKIIIPPPDNGDTSDGPPYFVKNTFAPDCWDPPATSSHARKCVRAKKMILPPDC